MSNTTKANRQDPNDLIDQAISSSVVESKKETTVPSTQKFKLNLKKLKVPAAKAKAPASVTIVPSNTALPISIVPSPAESPKTANKQAEKGGNIPISIIPSTATVPTTESTTNPTKVKPAQPEAMTKKTTSTPAFTSSKQRKAQAKAAAEAQAANPEILAPQISITPSQDDTKPGPVDVPTKLSFKERKALEAEQKKNALAEKKKAFAEKKKAFAEKKASISIVPSQDNAPAKAESTAPAKQFPSKKEKALAAAQKAQATAPAPTFTSRRAREAAAAAAAAPAQQQTPQVVAKPVIKASNQKLPTITPTKNKKTFNKSDVTVVPFSDKKPFQPRGTKPGLGASSTSASTPPVKGYYYGPVIEICQIKDCKDPTCRKTHNVDGKLVPPRFVAPRTMVTSFGKRTKAQQQQQQEQEADVTSVPEQTSGEKKSFKNKAQTQEPPAAPAVQPEKKSFKQKAHQQQQQAVPAPQQPEPTAPVQEKKSFKQKAPTPTPQQPQVIQQQQQQQQPQVIQQPQYQQEIGIVQHQPMPYSPSTLPVPFMVNNNVEYQHLYHHFVNDPSYIVVHVFSRRTAEAAAHVSIELPSAKFIEKHDVSVQYGKQPRLLAELFTLELALRLVIGLKQSVGLQNHKIAVFSSYNQGLQQFLLPVEEKSEFLTENATRVPDYAAYADMLQKAGMRNHVDFAVLSNDLARDPTPLTGAFIDAFKNVVELDSQPAPTEGDELKYGFIRANKKAYINRP